MEITCFKNSVLCGELTDFFIIINGGLDLETNLAVKLRDEGSGTLTDIICEFLDDKYRVTYCLSRPGNYRIFILINGNIVENRDVRGEKNDHYKESMARTDLLMMNRIDESYQRMERDRQLFLNSCAYECSLKVEINRILKEISTMKMKIEKMESALMKFQSKLDRPPANASENTGART